MEGSAQLVLVRGAALLYPEEMVFEAMIEGWGRQQASRLLGSKTIDGRLHMIRRFASFTNDYPWNWEPVDVEEWSAALLADGCAKGTKTPIGALTSVFAKVSPS